MTTSRLLAMVLSAAALAGPAPAARHAPPRRFVISDPDWVRRPDGAELFRLYPDTALIRHMSGRAKAMCDVLADGSLDACVVTQECPAGYGFGRATLLAAQDFRMRPKTVNGAPVGGGTVIVPVVWTPDASVAPADCAPGK